MRMSKSPLRTLASAISSQYKQYEKKGAKVTPPVIQGMLKTLQKTAKYDEAAVTEKIGALPADSHVPAKELLGIIKDSVRGSKSDRKPVRRSNTTVSRSRSPMRSKTSVNSKTKKHWTDTLPRSKGSPDLVHEEFKVRVFEYENTLTKLLVSSDIFEGFDKLLELTKIKTNSEQYQDFVKQLQQWCQKNPEKAKKVPKLAFTDFIIVVNQWFVANKPEFLRINPVQKVGPQTYLLLLMTVVKDYLFLRAKSKNTESIDKKLGEFTNVIGQIMGGITQGKTLQQLGLSVRGIEKELTLVLKAGNASFDSETLEFYKNQLRKLKRLKDESDLTPRSKTVKEGDLTPRSRTAKDGKLTPRSRTAKDGSLTPKGRTTKDRSLTPRGRTTKDRSLTPKGRTTKDRSLTPKSRTVKDGTLTPKGRTAKDGSLTPKGRTAKDGNLTPRRSRTAKEGNLTPKSKSVKGKTERRVRRSTTNIMSTTNKSRRVTPTPRDRSKSPVGRSKTMRSKTPTPAGSQVQSSQIQAVRAFAAISLANKQYLVLYQNQNKLLNTLAKLQKAIDAKREAEIKPLTEVAQDLRMAILKQWILEATGSSYIARIDPASVPLMNFTSNFVKKENFYLNRLKLIEKTMRAASRKGENIDTLKDQQQRHKNILAKHWFSDPKDEANRKVRRAEPRPETPSFKHETQKPEEILELLEIIKKYQSRKNSVIGIGPVESVGVLFNTGPNRPRTGSFSARKITHEIGVGDDLDFNPFTTNRHESSNSISPRIEFADNVYIQNNQEALKDPNTEEKKETEDNLQSEAKPQISDPTDASQKLSAFIIDKREDIQAEKLEGNADAKVETSNGNEQASGFNIESTGFKIDDNNPKEEVNREISILSLGGGEEFKNEEKPPLTVRNSEDIKNDDRPGLTIGTTDRVGVDEKPGISVGTADRIGVDEKSGLSIGTADKVKVDERPGLRIGSTDKVQVDERPGLSIGNSDKVGINEKTGLSIGSTEKVRVDERPGLSIGNSDKVGINERPGLSIGNSDKVGINERPGLSIGNSDKVGINERPELSIGSTEKVRVDERPGLSIGSTEKVRVDERPGLSIGSTEKVRVDEKPGLSIGNSDKVGINERPGLSIGNSDKVGINEKPGLSIGNSDKVGINERPGLSIGSTEKVRVDERPGLRIGNTEKVRADERPGLSIGNTEKIENSARGSRSIPQKNTIDSRRGLKIENSDDIKIEEPPTAQKEELKNSAIGSSEISANKQEDINITSNPFASQKVNSSEKKPFVSADRQGNIETEPNSKYTKNEVANSESKNSSISNLVKDTPRFKEKEELTDEKIAKNRNINKETNIQKIEEVPETKELNPKVTKTANFKIETTQATNQQIPSAEQYKKPNLEVSKDKNNNVVIKSQELAIQAPHQRQTEQQFPKNTDQAKPNSDRRLAFEMSSIEVLPATPNKQTRGAYKEGPEKTGISAAPEEKSKVSTSQIISISKPTDLHIPSRKNLALQASEDIEIQSPTKFLNRVASYKEKPEVETHHSKNFSEIYSDPRSVEEIQKIVRDYLHTQVPTHTKNSGTNTHTPTDSGILGMQSGPMFSTESPVNFIPYPVYYSPFPVPQMEHERTFNDRYSNNPTLYQYIKGENTHLVYKSDDSAYINAEDTYRNVENDPIDHFPEPSREAYREEIEKSYFSDNVEFIEEYPKDEEDLVITTEVILDKPPSSKSSFYIINEGESQGKPSVINKLIEKYKVPKRDNLTVEDEFPSKDLPNLESPVLAQDKPDIDKLFGTKPQDAKHQSNANKLKLIKNRNNLMRNKIETPKALSSLPSEIQIQTPQVMSNTPSEIQIQSPNVLSSFPSDIQINSPKLLSHNPSDIQIQSPQLFSNAPSGIVRTNSSKDFSNEPSAEQLHSKLSKILAEDKTQAQKPKVLQSLDRMKPSNDRPESTIKMPGNTLDKLFSKDGTLTPKVYQHDRNDTRGKFPDASKGLSNIKSHQNLAKRPKMDNAVSPNFEKTGSQKFDKVASQKLESAASQKLDKMASPKLDSAASQKFDKIASPKLDNPSQKFDSAATAKIDKALSPKLEDKNWPSHHPPEHRKKQGEESKLQFPDLKKPGIKSKITLSSKYIAPREIRLQKTLPSNRFPLEHQSKSSRSPRIDTEKQQKIKDIINVYKFFREEKQKAGEDVSKINKLLEYYYYLMDTASDEFYSKADNHEKLDHIVSEFKVLKNSDRPESREHKITEQRLLKELENVMNSQYEESLHYSYLMFLNNCFSQYSLSIDKVELEGFLKFCEDYQILQQLQAKNMSTQIIVSLFNHQGNYRGFTDLTGFRKLVRKIGEMLITPEQSVSSYAILSSQQKFEMFCEQLQRTQIQSSPSAKDPQGSGKQAKKNEPQYGGRSFTRNKTFR